MLYKQTHNISTKTLGPKALFSVQVSFVTSTFVDQYMDGKRILALEVCM